MTEIKPKQIILKNGTVVKKGDYVIKHGDLMNAKIYQITAIWEHLINTPSISHITYLIALKERYITTDHLYMREGEAEFIHEQDFEVKYKVIEDKVLDEYIEICRKIWKSSD